MQVFIAYSGFPNLRMHYHFLPCKFTIIVQKEKCGQSLHFLAIVTIAACIAKIATQCCFGFCSNAHMGINDTSQYLRE